MSASTSPHAYVSIRAGGVRSFNSPRGRGSVVFIDISSGAEAERIRELPPVVLREPRARLLFRLADPSGEEQVRALLERWDLGMDAALLEHPLGRPPRRRALCGEGEVDLAAARAIELEALLHWGGAIWRPRHHHFRLPSGEHAREFAKLADAIRSPRDARVLACWLLEWAHPHTGFVIDTGTLTPVIEAVQRMMIEGGVPPGPVAVLEAYPRNDVDVDTAVEVACGDEGRVVAILSVNSSGSVRDRLLAAIERQGEALREPRIVVMLDKHEPPRRAEISTWSPLPGSDPLLRAGSRAGEDCEDCRDPGRSRLVAINPRSFDGIAPGELRQVMPSLDDARENWRLWEVCSQNGAIAVESRSAAPVPALRASGLMPVRLRIDELVALPAFRALAAERLAAAIAAEPEFSPRCDLLLVPRHELGLAGFTGFWEELAPVVAPGAIPLGFDIEAEEFDPEVAARLADAHQVTIFAVGTVSGWSLQKALVTVQHTHPDHPLAVQAAVLHSRPASGREWQTLRNSFGNLLVAGFFSILPDRSPLAEERVLLEDLDRSSLGPAALELFEQRLRLCNGESEPPTREPGEAAGEEAARPEPAALFYGSGPSPRVSRNSIFGQRIEARAVYTAVAASMARAREQGGTEGPQFRVFDLAGIARSYYDPLILAAVLRWLHPHESWWGWQALEAERLVGALLERATASDREVLVPELLLAYAQGKVHAAAYPAIEIRAEQMRRGAEGELAAAIELTGALAARAREHASGPGEGPAAGAR